MKNITFLIFLLLCFSIIVAPVTAQTGNVVIAKYGSTPAFDGRVGDSEWNNASSFSFNGTQVFVKQDGLNLHIGFIAPIYVESGIFIMFDVNNDKSSSLQSDDLLIGITKNNSIVESYAEYGQWVLNTSSGWNAHSETVSNNTNFEFKISYAKLNIIAGNGKTLGINFRYDTSNNPPSLEKYFIWSNVGNVTYPEFDPSTWGTINSNGYNWIPEFPSLLTLLSLIITIPLVMIAWKKQSHPFKKTV